MAPMNCAQTEEAETTLGTSAHVPLYTVLAHASYYMYVCGSGVVNALHETSTATFVTCYNTCSVYLLASA